MLNTDNASTKRPQAALTWQSAAERNTLLKLWRRAVRIFFQDQTRCLRIGWVLADLFNAKTGYAYPSNKHLATETGIAENKVQAALLELEQGGAIMRRSIANNGQLQRVIYPAAALIPTPTVGVEGDPQQPGVQNLRKRTRLPKTEHERAKLAAEVRERRDRERGKVVPFRDHGLPPDEPAGAPACPRPCGRGGRAEHEAQYRWEGEQMVAHQDVVEMFVPMEELTMSADFPREVAWTVDLDGEGGDSWRV